MEVYVLYGRDDWHESVYDHDGNYFKEAPVTEVFTNFDSALKRLKEHAIKAYNFLKECNYIVDDRFAKNTTQEDLFDDYNLGRPDAGAPDYDVKWEYTVSYNKGRAHWQMYLNNFYRDRPIPILPGLHIRKVKLED